MSFSSSTTFPDDFMSLVREMLPDENALKDFIAISQRPLRRSIRINTLKISVAEFQQTLPAGWVLRSVPWCKEGFWLERDEQDEDLPLGSVSEHLSGLFYLQEASSMLPVSALFDAIPTPYRVLDVAAAPGSKTTQLAAGMSNQGGIIANEYSASRIKVLHASLSRCGVRNTALTHFDGRVFGAALPESFDAILLDAPCSGEGVIRKDPGALRNWSIQSTQDIAATQRDLIDSAFHALQPGGILVYSTCTLNPIENQQVISWLVERYPGAVDILPLSNLFPGCEKALTPEGFLHVFPHYFDSEGFFVARLKKNRSIPRLPAPKYKPGHFPFTPVDTRLANEITQAANNIGLWWDDSSRLWCRDDEIWLFPQAITPFFNQIRFSRPGIKLAVRFTKGFRWQYEAIITLAKTTSDNSIELSEAEAIEWYRGRDIYTDTPLPRHELLLTWQKQPLGLVKKVGNRLKNSYPRELVRDGKLFRR